MTLSRALLLIALGGAVVVLFVLALAETSLLHVRRSAVVVAADAGDRRAVRLARLLDDLPRVLNSVLLAVLAVQVGAATAAGALAQDRFGNTGVTVATAVVTVVLFVYGEAVPKTLAIQHPMAVARRLATPVRWLAIALRPVVTVLLRVADLQTRGRASSRTADVVSEAELRLLADDAASAGSIDESDADLIERSFAFGDLTVGDVIVPRARVVAIAAATTVEDALEVAIAAGHRRLPVYEGDLDRVVGFVRLRDLAEIAADDPTATVGARVRDVLRVGAQTPVAVLLRRMQQFGRHLAVVADDAGTTEGIVTIEDAVEELVGTIEDPEPPSGDQ